jgi:hypothetical protein
MEASDIRNLQEAYLEVYGLDEELTGERKKKALEKGGYLANRVASGKEGQPVERRNRSGGITMRTTTKAPSKRGGEESKGERKTDWSGYEADRGSGNKAAKRAAQSNESYDLYDIILLHLLDEGYTNSIESAEVILDNMSEGWMESIMEAFVDPETGETPSGRSPLENVSYHSKKSVRKKAMRAFAKQMSKEYGGKYKAKTEDPTKED